MAADHLSICICTFKRPEILKRSIEAILAQDSNNIFTYSIIIVDNDQLRSAEPTVNKFGQCVVYDVEPVQNISMARNRAISHAKGDYIVLIDDDEIPGNQWLLNLYNTHQRYKKDGVLGPVKPLYDDNTPAWLVKSGICERKEFETGTLIDSKYTRTGNVLLSSKIFDSMEQPFDPQFGRTGGEDTDFFTRVMSKGCQFVWCNEAPVYEIIPPERCKKTFYIKRALLRGQNNYLRDKQESTKSKYTRFVKSMIGLALYSCGLPVVLFQSEDRKFRFYDKYFHHAGRILKSIGITLVKGR